MRAPDKWSRCRPIFREFSFRNAWRSPVTLIAAHGRGTVLRIEEEAGAQLKMRNTWHGGEGGGGETRARNTRGRVTGRVCACVCVYRGGLFASPLPLNTGLLDAGTSCRNKCTAHKYAATICNQTVGSFSVSSKFLRLWNVYNPSVFDSCTWTRKSSWPVEFRVYIYIYARGYIRERRPFPSSSGTYAKLFGEIKQVSSLTDTSRSSFLISLLG